MAAGVPRDAEHGDPVLENRDLHAQLPCDRRPDLRRRLRVERLYRAHGDALHHHPIRGQLVLVSVFIGEVLDVLLVDGSPRLLVSHGCPSFG